MQLLGPDVAEGERVSESFPKVIILLYLPVLLHVLVPPQLFILGTKDMEEKLLMLFVQGPCCFDVHGSHHCRKIQFYSSK